MATNHTANYNLNQWQATDPVLRSDFNEDNAKIDAALKSLNAASQQHTTQLSQLQTSLSKHGDCKLHYTIYEGDGSDSRTFTFPHKPVYLFLYGRSNVNLMIPRDAPFCYLDESTAALSWSEKSLTITARGPAGPVFNVMGEKYYLLALLDAAN